ncbi:MAG: uroporphyrinogen decarboxylase [Kiritimatiellaceae bacterium]|jgi:uroporphyrinogen decarboxylase|nr:uroporphyrinogen decarboxylase [Kiritimatiellaceae bacterium]
MTHTTTYDGRKRFLNALHCRSCDRPPIWMMRQAGRSLPEYLALKEGKRFTDLVQNPEVAAEVTLQPIRRFQYDAAVIFSDILVIAEAMGVPYQLMEQGGVKVDFQLQSRADIEKLTAEGAANKIAYTPAAIELVRNEVENQCAIIGFAGSPWTLASFMVEGGSSRDNLRSRALIHEQPALFEALLEKITLATIDYLNAQIDAGADALQLFDSQGGTLAQAAYWRFSGRWMQQIITALGQRVPVTVFGRGVHQNWEQLIQTGANALSIDWNIDLPTLSKQLPSTLALQGNLDPALLTASPSVAIEQTQRLLDGMRDRNGFIFNLGHGVPPNAYIETIAAIAQTVQTYHG